MIARTAVVAGTATAVSGRVARRQQAKFADQAAEQAPPEEQYAPPPQEPAAAAPAGDDMDELRQLAELHQQGILTDEEFAAKKAQILGI
jgi:hypothetical protein